MHWRFSLTDQARFFFEPVEFDCELANLAVELVAFGFQFLVLGRVLTGTLEKGLDAVGRLLFPGSN